MNANFKYFMTWLNIRTLPSDLQFFSYFVDSCIQFSEIVSKLLSSFFLNSTKKCFYLDFLNSILQVAIFGSSNRPNFGAAKKATWRKISQPEKTDAWDAKLLVEEFLSEHIHLISKLHQKYEIGHGKHFQSSL